MGLRLAEQIVTQAKPSCTIEPMLMTMAGVLVDGIGMIDNDMYIPHSLYRAKAFEPLRT